MSNATWILVTAAMLGAGIWLGGLMADAEGNSSPAKITAIALWALVIAAALGRLLP